MQEHSLAPGSIFWFVACKTLPLREWEHPFVWIHIKLTDAVLSYNTASSTLRQPKVCTKKHSDLWAIGKKQEDYSRILREGEVKVCVLVVVPDTNIKAYIIVRTSCINLSVHFQLVMHCFCSSGVKIRFMHQSKKNFVVLLWLDLLMYKVSVKILNLLYSNL